jgi:tetratricopeptide (TPR) repeat protein
MEMAAKSKINLRLGLVLAGLAVLSCSPRLLDQGEASRNPIDILDKSPRIYEIAFKSFADSLETARASSYIAGSLDVALFPGARIEAALGDSEAAEGLQPREVAEVEYIKARRRFDAGASGAAAYHLKQALAADHTYRPAYLLLGELLLERGAVGEACDLFGKVLEQDSTDSDAFIGLARCHMLMGRVDDARKALVDAVIFDRVNLKAWSMLSSIVEFQGCQLANHDAPELGLVRKLRGRHFKILIDQSLQDCPVEATAWIAYASERAVWKYEDKYKEYFGVTKYARTYEEDVDCYMVLAAAWETLAQRDSAACDPAYLDYLDRVAVDGYLVSHVLFDRVCIDAPGAARFFTVDVIAKLREYINAYVIVPKS